MKTTLVRRYSLPFPVDEIEYHPIEDGVPEYDHHHQSLCALRVDGALVGWTILGTLPGGRR